MSDVLELTPKELVQVLYLYFMNKDDVFWKPQKGYIKSLKGPLLHIKLTYDIIKKYKGSLVDFDCPEPIAKISIKEYPDVLYYSICDLLCAIKYNLDNDIPPYYITPDIDIVEEINISDSIIAYLISTGRYFKLKEEYERSVRKK